MSVMLVLRRVELGIRVSLTERGCGVHRIIASRLRRIKPRRACGHIVTPLRVRARPLVAQLAVGVQPQAAACVSFAQANLPWHAAKSCT
jgi:antitoxin (DNA-binding transcriptional repressor) of toxin-antitoxin stability system